MVGIPILKFDRTQSSELEAMRRNYAETFGVPINRVRWRQKKTRRGREMYLYLTPLRQEARPQ